MESLKSPKKHPRSDVLQERRRKAYNVEYYKAAEKRFMVTICHKKYVFKGLFERKAFSMYSQTHDRLGFTISDE